MSMIYKEPGTYTKGAGIVRVKKTTEEVWQDLVHVKEFKISVEMDELVHDNVRSGLKKQDKIIPTGMKAKGSMVIDVPIIENLQFYLMGVDPETISQTGGTWTAEAKTVKTPNKWQDLGKRFLTITTITDDATPTPHALEEGVDYYIDLIRGLFLPLSTSSYIGQADDGFKITGSYETKSYKSMKAGGQKQIIREIWFAGDPAAGKVQDIRGYANIKPGGELSMIGDEWENFTLELSFMSHSSYGEVGVIEEEIDEVEE